MGSTGDGALLTGAWDVDSEPVVLVPFGQPHVKDAATLSGTVEGSNVTATLASNKGAGCLYRVSAVATSIAATSVVQADLHLEGTYTTRGCGAAFGAAGPAGGTLDLSGQ